MADKRKLTEKEEARLEEFKMTVKAYEEDGYETRDLTISALKANLIARIFGLILYISVLYYYSTVQSIDMSPMGLGLADPSKVSFREYFLDIIFLFLAFVVLMGLHELIHGITWAIFGRDGWEAISFGFMTRYLSPYCTTKSPLDKGTYILGALMPLILLGIIPLGLGLVLVRPVLTMVGLIMTLGGMGDLLMVTKILKDGKSLDLILDHPSDIGCLGLNKK